jgi:hypothetical protein
MAHFHWLIFGFLFVYSFFVLTRAFLAPWSPQIRVAAFIASGFGIIAGILPFLKDFCGATYYRKVVHIDGVAIGISFVAYIIMAILSNKPKP